MLDGSDDNDEGASDDEENANTLPASITLLAGLGVMKKRKRHCVMKFHKEKKEGEDHYRNLLMLYFPWRDEAADLKGDFPPLQSTTKV